MGQGKVLIKECLFLSSHPCIHIISLPSSFSFHKFCTYVLVVGIENVTSLFRLVRIPFTVTKNDEAIGLNNRP